MKFKNIKVKISKFLGNHSNFIRGMGSIVDLSGSSLIDKKYSINKILNKTDKEALAEDWKIVGNDFKKVMGIKEDE